MLFLLYFVLVFIVVGVVRVGSRKRLAGLVVTVDDIGTVRARRFARSIMVRNISALAAGGVVLWALDLVNQAQPGWYGLPLIGLTVLLAAATLFALGRIASAARSEQFSDLDRAVRILATRVVMQLSSGALFLYFGGVLLFAGWTTSNAATVFAPGGVALSSVQPAAAIGLTEVIAGLVVALLGGVLVILAILDATRQPLGRVAVVGTPAVDAASARES
ncbi:hypothetical protein E3T35_00490 [Cryobacterium sp. TMT1-2-2]|uniref:hypothetical protein n=1 Tax=Cryobacterium sp. TMT1-2-2 TaxID=1259233 RepID=UPI00106A8D2B|nr:hypothetical protein [Cryobacterium sp. TMT1-2-2]TFD14908.1 hypothetical protein E3T35_00490 [Cryobacterium sp. TMT1-2-2]